MFGRPMLFAGVLIAAAVVPYVLLDENISKTARGQWNRLVGKTGEKKADGGANLKDAAGSTAGALAPATAVSQGAAIEEIFRFDVTPQWVTSR